jgi:hypothetical protein
MASRVVRRPYSSFTRVLRGHDRPLGAHQNPLLRGQPLLRARRELLRGARVACDERGRERRALPQVVVAHLGDRRAEPVLQLGFRREHVLALAFQRPRLREMELDGEDRDEAGAQDSSGGEATAPAGAGSSSDVRSTSRVS